jgi:hypothetical protein
MKGKFAVLFSLGVVLAFIACGGGGGGSNGSTPTNSISNSSVIGNPILENSVPIGVSTYALGTIGKFPLDDAQSKDGIGYKTVAETVQHIATNELYTFTENQQPASEQQVEAVLQGFINDGHSVFHEIHIIYGPGIRNNRDVWIQGVIGYQPGATGFEKLLETNQTVKDAVLNLFVGAVEHAKRLEAIGVTVVICPELEDNHVGSAEVGFTILMDTLQKAGWTNPDGSLRVADMVRNSMPGGKTPAGVRTENHGDPSAMNTLQSGDIFNNDGKGLAFPTDQFQNNRVSESSAKNAQAKAQATGIIYFVWSDQLQGWWPTDNYGTDTALPTFYNRNYEVHNPVGLISILLNIPDSQVIVNK